MSYKPKKRRSSQNIDLKGLPINLEKQMTVNESINISRVNKEQFSKGKVPDSPEAQKYKRDTDTSPEQFQDPSLNKKYTEHKEDPYKLKGTIKTTERPSLRYSIPYTK
jgi:hypothetical protein